ncbi:sugar isomerase domain-containing protein, partial [Streptomyces sp. NPDC002172]
LSGRNALPVEMAISARDRGAKVIGVTSVAYADETTSRHASGTYLKDHCDIVLDSKIAVGDAELTLDTIPAPFAPASTVVTSALLQAVLATTAATLADRGTEPPLLRSGNVDGGHEWNARVFEEYRDRIFYQQ